MIDLPIFEVARGVGRERGSQLIDEDIAAGAVFFAESLAVERGGAFQERALGLPIDLEPDRREVLDFAVITVVAEPSGVARIRAHVEIPKITGERRD